MRVLVLTFLYPNRSQPVHAVFVEERVRALAARVDVAAVVCPIPWFPGAARLARYRHRRAIPHRETRDGVEVRYPRYLSIPGLLKPLDGFTTLLAAWWTARRLHRRRHRPFDVIDAQWAFPTGFAAVLLGKLLRLPVAVTVRGTDVNRLPSFPLRRRQVQWTLRHADAVLCVADALRTTAGALGAPPERTETVPNGVDLERFTPRDTNTCRDALGWPRRPTPIVLAVGHLVPRKRVSAIVRALPVVHRRFPDARLVIVGGPGEEGDDRAAIDAAIDAAGVAAHVDRVGAVVPDELPRHYGAADVLCLASEREGRANVLLEALACGLRIVATRVWGSPELVTSTTVGRLVDDVDPETLGAALTATLAEPADAATIAAQASPHSWAACAERVETALRRISAIR